MELKEFVLWHKAEEAPKDILKDIYEVDQFGIIRYAAAPISCTYGNPEENYLATIIYGEAYSSWFTLEYILSSKDIVKVLDAPENRITDGKVLWQKPKEVVLTMDEIAEKFGYSVEQIKIKK